MITIRLPPDLLTQVDLIAGVGKRTAMIEYLLSAYVERRIVVTSCTAPPNTGTLEYPAEISK